jgi:hypothetical protein
VIRRNVYTGVSLFNNRTSGLTGGAASPMFGAIE